MKNRFIGITSSPTLIVGEQPGRQRKKDATGEVFHGNRTGDFIESVIVNKTNIILTNANNGYQLLSEGIQDLHQLIKVHRPGRIICLGKKARKAIECIISARSNSTAYLPHDNIFYLDHPSYRLRFNIDISQYKKTLQCLLKPSM